MNPRIASRLMTAYTAVVLLGTLAGVSYAFSDANMLARPTSRFTITCKPAPSLTCDVKSTSLGNPVKFTWSWGDGRTESHTIPTATNVWRAPGAYTVRLTVKDSIGGSSYSTQKITLPIAKAPCTCVDTVTITKHDTVQVPVPPTVPPASPPPPSAPPPAAPTGETWAELPRVYLDTKMPATTGKVISVPAGGDLQAALNAAQPCDAIELANAGTWTGNFTLPNKAGACWIVIRPANMTVLPPEGTRLSPAKAGRLPLILSPSNQGAITTDVGAHHWRLVGLEVSVPSTIGNTGLIRLGTGYELTLAQMPHDIVLDRMYVHGTATGIVRRAVALNGASQAVVDSYISECHDMGPDSQAIAGWNGPGPFKIVNNYLEAASENVLFGGGDPTVGGLIPSDIEIRRNHVTKPLAWSHVGYAVKNLFEIKNAQRVLVEGNVFESNWGEGQGGSAIVLKSVNQGGACKWCVAQDLTFRLNLIRNTGAGFALTGFDPNTPVPMTRVTITDNIVSDIDVAPFNGDGRGFLINNDPVDLVIAHNTVLDPTNSAITFGGPDTLPPLRLTFRDNIVGAGLYTIAGPGMNVKAALATFMPTGGFVGNLLTSSPSIAYAFPAGNFFGSSVSGIGFVSATDLRLASTSQFKAKTGRDPGADVDAVLAAIAGVVIP